ncbi:hypothetical protein, partial [Klebsiella michiganensis]|uniref:hypothetical protein n=1 Tax=Klebsiella michiganensis TaxID=1134687 RepID=UPI00254BF4B4
AHDVPLGCAPDEYDDLISGTCSHLPYHYLPWDVPSEKKFCSRHNIFPGAHKQIPFTGWSVDQKSLF